MFFIRQKFHKIDDEDFCFASIRVKEKIVAVVDPSPLWGGWPSRSDGRVGVEVRGSLLPNEKARALRKRLTPQEVKLWVRLRELKTLGFHFRKQAPIGRYIVDFVSFGAQIVIEVDGGQHGMHDGARSDRDRDSFLRSQGFRVLRFWNSDVDKNSNGVMESILAALKTPTPVLRTDPPHKGEG